MRRAVSASNALPFPEIPLFARRTPISSGPVGTLTIFKTSATGSRDFWRFPTGYIQDCHYKSGFGLRNGHKSRIFPRGESVRGGLRSPFAEQRLQDECNVGRSLSEPAHEIRKPFAAERDVDTDAIAARRKCRL